MTTHPFFWEGKSKGKQQLKKMSGKKSGLEFLILNALEKN